MTSSKPAAEIELYGLPFSTFTRSISLGLTELGISYTHHSEVEPHSEPIEALNPFGLLPALVHRSASGQGMDVVLYEANAVRRYIDEELYAKQKSAAAPPLTPSENVYLRARVDQLVSIASSTLFQTVEHGVVKPRLGSEQEGDREESIVQSLQGEPLEKLHSILDIVESIGAAGSMDYFLTQEGPTWADLFMYPALADLRSIPEGAPLHSEARYPWLSSWLNRMDARDSAKQTFEGTLASQRAKD